MSKRYPGNLITGNPVALSQTSNNGIWDTKDIYHAVNAGTWQEPDGIYEIGRSLRFKNSTNSLLTRTPATAGNRRTWTWSGWVKRASLGGTGGTQTYQVMMEADGTGSPGNRTSFMFDNVDRIDFFTDNTSTSRLRTSAVFRDLSAWYHVVFAMDTTQSQASNRMKIYVNGVQISAFETETYPSQNLQSGVNYNAEHRIGKPYDTFYYEGYMTEINHIDGQQLDASYFGYFDPNTNIWMPKKYTGGYGTNGFYLPFSENQTLRNLGRNFAGGTNFCPYSESVASWGNTNCTITSNSTTAPNGSTTADTVAASSTASAYMRQDTGINMGISTHYTMSVYLKAGTATTATLSDGYGTGAYVTVNLTSGAVTAAYNPYGYQEYTVTFVGDGWYRVTNSFITHSSGDYNIGLRVDPGRGYGDTGASGASVYVWGAQINLGKTADAYVRNDVSTRIDTNWTPNNFSITAGATYDSMVDSPTNVFTSATDIGGVVPGNYCTLNPLSKLNWLSQNDTVTPSNGNLQFAVGVGGNMMDGTIAVSSGKWYWEQTQTAYQMNGIRSTSGIPTGDLTYRYYQGNGQIQYVPANSTSATILTTVATSASGVIIGIALDLDNRTISWYKDNALLYTATNIVADTYAPCAGAAATTSGGVINFGQRPFAYTPPTGFKSLNTTNLQALGTTVTGKAAVQANKWFDINIYGGTSSAVTDITNSGFKPDLVWIKNRRLGAEDSGDNMFFDTVRGPTAALQANRSISEAIQTNFLTAFNENGFRPGTSTRTNETTAGYVAWQWKQSPTSGFNIIPYTGNGASSRTISHNLGVAPKFIITKRRESSNWWVYHQGQQAQYPGQWLYLNATNLSQSTANATDAPYFKTDPTSSVFSIAGDGINTNGGTYISYLWAEVPGFSKFGSYTGNGSSDGIFVYTGFRPKFVLFKPLSGTAWNWNHFDAARNQNTNPMTNYLAANNADAEGLTSTAYVDYTSNGFKLRNAFNNTSGENYVYVAFAESPFALNNRAR